MTRHIQGIHVPTQPTETYMDIPCPRDYWIQSVMISNVYAGCSFYARYEFYYDDSDEHPEVLFTGWFRATTGHYNNMSIPLNKKVYSERGILRINFLCQAPTAIDPVVIVNFGPEPTGSAQTSHYDIEENRGVWAYDDLIERHTDAGTIEMSITPVAGSWFELEYISLTPALTGAEDISLEIQDAAGGVLALLIDDNTQTGTLRGPNQIVHVGTEITTTPETVGQPTGGRVRIQSPDCLYLTVSACPATDDIHIMLRARLKDRIPIIAYVGNVQSQAAYVNEYSSVT